MASESQHQMAVIKWSQQPSVRRQWPELALLYHIKNETTEGPKAVMGISEKRSARAGRFSHTLARAGSLGKEPHGRIHQSNFQQGLP